MKLKKRRVWHYRERKCILYNNFHKFSRPRNDNGLISPGFSMVVWTLRIRRYMRLYGDGRSGHSLRWNGQPLKCSGFPVLLPIPFSPVQRARKFSAVLGTTSAKSSNTIRPAAKRKKKHQEWIIRLFHWSLFMHKIFLFFYIYFI